MSLIQFYTFDQVYTFKHEHNSKLKVLFKHAVYGVVISTFIVNYMGKKYWNTPLTLLIQMFSVPLPQVCEVCLYKCGIMGCSKELTKFEHGALIGVIVITGTSEHVQFIPS